MGGKFDCHRTKSVTRMGKWEVHQIVTEQRCNQDGPMGGKLDCHRTKGVIRMDQWEVNQIVTEQRV